MTANYLPIAVRAWTERVSPKKTSRERPSRAASKRALRPRLILVIDTETTKDHILRFKFGSYRVCLITWTGGIPQAACLEEGLFYADDLPQTDPLGFEILRQYAASHLADVMVTVIPRLKLVSQRDFVNRVFYHWAWRKRAIIVAHNLPFDDSRIAYECGIARRGTFAGGFSLALWGRHNGDGTWKDNPYRPRIAIKTIDSKRHLIGFKAGAEDRISNKTSGRKHGPEHGFQGHFLDLHTLNFALTDENDSLDSACRRWDVEHGKTTAPEHGRITPKYIDYNRNDVRAEVELSLKLLEEYNRHSITMQPTKAFSPASIGKAYLNSMGIQQILISQPDFPMDILGYAMIAFFGGRAEGRIRRVPVPVVYMDFKSMYPTVCCLMKIWRFLTCEHIEVEDATESVRSMLSSPTLLRDCFKPETWENFVGLVQIVPDGDILPERACHDGAESTWQIGVNPLKCNQALWYTIPDAVASTLLSMRSPHILKAIRLVPRGTASTLRPVRLRGAVPIDPYTQDFFKIVIEERERVRRGRGLSKEDKDRLQHFLKILANATSYGINAEMVRHELPPGEQETVRVHGLDGAFETKVSAPEDPGEFAFPPLAACITGAARLMLALLERLVTDAGGTHAFCDTDGVAVVATETGGLVPCPGGPQRLREGQAAIPALSWARAEEIRERFATLNPYDKTTVPGSILKLEEENFDKAPGERRQVWCYVISAKRYALYNLDERGEPILRKWSEHGLGHLLNPKDPKRDDRDWIRTLWEGIVTEELGHPYAWPDWLRRPAVGRITVSGPSLLRLFHGMNRGIPYADRIKPFNFLLTTFVRAFGYPGAADPEQFHLVAPWNPDPRQWLIMTWIDRYSGRRFRITATGETGGEGIVRVKTYGDVLAAYRVHPEPKSLGADGKPCGRHTRGLLNRRFVATTADLIGYIGKESNKLDDREAGLIHDLDEVVTEYADPRRDPFKILVLPVLQTLPPGEIARKITIAPRTLRDIVTGRTYPHSGHKTRLMAFAVNRARDALRGLGITPPTYDLACCAAYLEEWRRRRVRVCPTCQGPLTHSRSRYCSSPCRQRAYRSRKSRENACRRTA